MKTFDQEAWTKRLQPIRRKLIFHKRPAESFRRESSLFTGWRLQLPLRRNKNNSLAEKTNTPASCNHMKETLIQILSYNTCFLRHLFHHTHRWNENNRRGGGRRQTMTAATTLPINMRECVIRGVSETKTNFGGGHGYSQRSRVCDRWRLAHNWNAIGRRSDFEPRRIPSPTRAASTLHIHTKKWKVE